MQSCDVITEHMENGHVIPLKFRIRECDEYNVFTIKSFVELPQTYGQKGIKRYRCKIVMNDVLRECELIFYKDTMKWILAGIK